MAINMQGPWRVSVKSKSALFLHRFIVSGASSGNGTYAGEVATPPVEVTGSAWSITIQNNPGTGFIDSIDQVKFPTTSGGRYSFDIESNDAGADLDFNDLILTCSTPVTTTDFLVYGNATYYAGRCIVNPCRRDWVVIDTAEGLALALNHRDLRVAIEKLYPERVSVGPRPPGPIPDPPPFRALVIPMGGPTAIPPKQSQVFRLSGSRQISGGASKGQESPLAISSIQTLSSQRLQAASVDFNRIAVASALDNLRFYCETGALGGVVLRFQEYDRTSAELAGGSYTGEGGRETLGACATDRNGNYIFRFSRTPAQFVTEAITDVVVGEDAVVQSMPDIIVQLLDLAGPTEAICYESAPYWNVPVFSRIDLCVPKACVGRLPTACQGQNAIQAVGNIFIGQPQGGDRVGFNNFLGAEGRITARNTLGPQTSCAAWAGSLDLFACFLDANPKVTHYTIQFSRRLPNNSWTAWAPYLQEYRHPKIANIGLPNYNGDLVGPVPVPPLVGGGAAGATMAYHNIESDAAWVLTKRDRKAQIWSPLYAPQPGPVKFRIEGYSAAGNKVGGADDSLTLFIDNTAPDFAIQSVTMGVQAGGDCALFSLGGNGRAPMTVSFKANQLQGFMDSYSLTVRKGNIGNVSIVGNPAGLISGSYVHGDDLSCSQFRGTRDTAGVSGFISVDVQPPVGGAWLDVGQPFCTFAVNLSCSTRITNGYTTGAGYGPTQYLLGIQQ